MTPGNTMTYHTVIISDHKNRTIPSGNWLSSRAAG